MSFHFPILAGHIIIKQILEVICIRICIHTYTFALWGDFQSTRSFHILCRSGESIQVHVKQNTDLYFTCMDMM